MTHSGFLEMTNNRSSRHKRAVSTCITTTMGTRWPRLGYQ
jgi:hypothetical protein